MSHRASSDQALSLGPDQLATLLSSTQELLALLQLDGSLLHLNESFSRLLGYNADQLSGASIFSFMHPNEADTFRARLQSRHSATPHEHGHAQAHAPTQAPNHNPKVRCRLQSKDGSWRWFEAAFRNLLHDPAIEAIVVSLADVTDLQRMESERQVTHRHAPHGPGGSPSTACPSRQGLRLARTSPSNRWTTARW